MRPDTWRQVLPLILIGATFALFVITGLQGIDFGFHWDEDKQFANLIVSLQNELLLPRWYKYPSISYWLTLTTTFPHILAALPNSGGDWHVLQDHLLLVAATPAFHLQVRAVFLMVSALAIFWTGLQPPAGGRSLLEGALAAALLGLSWEFAYHARWIAPDTILLQSGALFLLLATQAVRRPTQTVWLIAAAAVAGLAAGTKYPGGLLLIPAWTIAVLVVRSHANTQTPGASARTSFRPTHLLRAALFTFPAFVLVYVASTPGTLLDPVTFYKDVAYEIGHYGTGRFDQTVVPGLPHLLLIVQYFGQVFFSRYMPIALFFSVLLLTGSYSLLQALKQNHLNAQAESVLFLGFPAIYLLYFSMQRVMAARNLLLVAPFFALLAARGAFFVLYHLPKQSFRLGFGILLAGLLGINAAWLVLSASSIQMRGTGGELTGLVDYARSLTDQEIAVSPGVWAALQTEYITLPANLHLWEGGNVEYVAFYASEAYSDPRHWPANRPGLALVYFGPWEVNFDYYPLWAGDDRILLMELDRAVRLNIEPFATP